MRLLANIKVLSAPVLALAVPPVYKILKALSLHKFFFGIISFMGGGGKVVLNLLMHFDTTLDTLTFRW